MKIARKKKWKTTLTFSKNNLQTQKMASKKYKLTTEKYCVAENQKFNWKKPKRKHL